MSIIILADSETLLIVILRIASPIEKSFMTGVNVERETYKEDIINYVPWTRNKFNLADTVTKESILSDFVNS